MERHRRGGWLATVPFVLDAKYRNIGRDKAKTSRLRIADMIRDGELSHQVASTLGELPILRPVIVIQISSYPMSILQKEFG